MSRITCPVLAAKVTTAEEAVAHIHDGDNVGFSGFTGAGYPKAVPAALAATMIRAHDQGRQFQVGLWTGASTAPDADGVLAAAHGISTRLPYNSDPTLRGMINAGDVRYTDAHLSHSAQHMWFGLSLSVSTVADQLAELVCGEPHAAEVLVSTIKLRTRDIGHGCSDTRGSKASAGRPQADVPANESAQTSISAAPSHKHNLASRHPAHFR